MGLLNFYFHQGFTVALTGTMVIELFSNGKMPFAKRIV